MTHADLCAYYGSAVRAAEKLGVTRAAVSLWKRYGIPPGRQAMIQIATHGKLRAGGNGKARA